MNEEQNQNQDVVLPVVEQTAQAEAPRESEREYNLRLLAEQRDMERQARERAERELERMRQVQAQMQIYQQPQRPTVEEDEPDDVYVDNKKFKHYKSEQQRLKEEYESMKREITEMKQRNATDYIRGRYSDFDDVASDENLVRLNKAKPSLYASIMKNEDLKERGEALYDAIKSLPSPKRYEHIDQKMAENKAIPRSAASVAPQSSDSPLARLADSDRISLRPEEAKEQRKKYLEARARMR